MIYNCFHSLFILLQDFMPIFPQALCCFMFLLWHHIQHKVSSLFRDALFIISSILISSKVTFKFFLKVLAYSIFYWFNYT